MKIVMIDRSTVIDRRIILEATSLTRQGHAVEIISSSVSDLDRKFLPEGIVVNFVEDEFLNSSMIHTRSAELAPILGKRLSLFVSVLLSPKNGLRFVSHANSLSRSQKLFLSGALGFFAGSASFLKAVAKIFKAVAASFNGQFVPDDWEERVIASLGGKQFDVVHVHDLPALPLGVFLKKKYQAKLVYDAHELYCYLPGMSPLAQRNMKSVESANISHADLVVVINEDQAKQMSSDHGVFPYVCLTNATDVGVVGGRRPIRESLGIPISERVILFQGYVSKERNIDVLIEGLALSAARPHLVLLSWGPEIPEFRSQATRLGVQDRVHFVPPVPWDQVLEWVRDADVGIMPYQPTNLNTIISSPNKMYEFIVAKTPMIGSSELINVQRTIAENGFGVVRPLRAPADYAAAIDEMFNDDAAKWNRAKSALEERWQNFTWESLSKDFLARYQNLGVS